jgi:hypothetical protein
MPRGEQFHRLELPALLAELLQRLPDSIRTAHSIRVTAEKDTPRYKDCPAMARSQESYLQRAIG